MCHTKNELKSAVAKYRKLVAEKAVIESELNEVKASINEYLDYKSIQPNQKVVGQNYIVSFTIYSQGRFNTEKLKQELGDNLEFFKDYKEYRRLNIK